MTRRAASLPPDPIEVLALTDDRHELVARAPKGRSFSAGTCEQVRRYRRVLAGEVVACARLIRFTVPSAGVEAARQYLDRLLALAAPRRAPLAGTAPSSLPPSGYKLSGFADRAMALIRHRPGLSYDDLADELGVSVPLAQHVAERLIREGRIEDADPGRRQA